MVAKYSVLIGRIKEQDEKFQIKNITAESVTIEYSSVGGSTVFELTQTYGLLTIIWKINNPLFGNHSLEWEFDENYTQRLIFDKIESDLTEYQNIKLSNPDDGLYELNTTTPSDEVFEVTSQGSRTEDSATSLNLEEEDDDEFKLSIKYPKVIELVSHGVAGQVNVISDSADVFEVIHGGEIHYTKWTIREVHEDLQITVDSSIMGESRNKTWEYNTKYGDETLAFTLKGHAESLFSN